MLIPYFAFRFYFQKPNLSDFKNSLLSLRSICLHMGIKTLAVPKLGKNFPHLFHNENKIKIISGCGKDQLDYNEVKDLLLEVFSKTLIQIIVYLGNKHIPPLTIYFPDALPCYNYGPHFTCLKFNYAVVFSLQESLPI